MFSLGRDQLQEQVIQLYNQLISLRNVMLEQSRVIEKLTKQKSRAGELRGKTHQNGWV